MTEGLGAYIGGHTEFIQVVIPRKSQLAEQDVWLPVLSPTFFRVVKWDLIAHILRIRT